MAKHGKIPPSNLKASDHKNATTTKDMFEIQVHFDSDFPTETVLAFRMLILVQA